MTAALRNLPDWRRRYWIAVPVVLAVPAVAMAFSREMNWGAEDFLILALLLVLAGLAAEGAVGLARTRTGRLVGIAGVALVFLTICAQLAVGIV